MRRCICLLILGVVVGLILGLSRIAPDAVQAYVLQSTPIAQNVELIGQIGGPTQAVAVQGNYAYVGIGPALNVFEISNPAQPRHIGQAVLPDILSGVAVAGSYAYVAGYEKGLWVINIADPTKPVEVGFYGTPGGQAEGMAVAGSYAYVADRAGLRVINIADPAKPVEVGFYDTRGDAQDVAVAGSYAYVVTASYGLRVINIANPATPTEVGFYSTRGGNMAWPWWGATPTLRIVILGCG